MRARSLILLVVSAGIVLAFVPTSSGTPEQVLAGKNGFVTLSNSNPKTATVGDELPFAVSTPTGGNCGGQTATLVWSVTNGTVVGGQGTKTATIRFTGVGSSTVTVNRTDNKPKNCLDADSQTVAVSPLTLWEGAAGGGVSSSHTVADSTTYGFLLGSSGPCLQNGATYQWTASSIWSKASGTGVAYFPSGTTSSTLPTVYASANPSSVTFSVRVINAGCGIDTTSTLVTVNISPLTLTFWEGSPGTNWSKNHRAGDDVTYGFNSTSAETACLLTAATYQWTSTSPWTPTNLAGAAWMFADDTVPLQVEYINTTPPKGPGVSFSLTITTNDSACGGFSVSGSFGDVTISAPNAVQFPGGAFVTESEIVPPGPIPTQAVPFAGFRFILLTK